MESRWIKIFQIAAAFLGFTAVLLGAVGAHILSESPSLKSFETATRFQLMHAIFLIVVSSRSRATSSLISIGCVFFCGSIYLKTMTGMEFWSNFTPIGGLLLMAAWMSVGFLTTRVHPCEWARPSPNEVSSEYHRL
ncbi:MAG: DUF423 domain-containing protein [Myxococcaceae bacterium]|nr:DUF423 domain-containing protein [Myxococcaceae bacterium]MBH2006228.1 DUF423 domain-containing protein [Myxococcaceae bacterium]